MLGVWDESGSGRVHPSVHLSPETPCPGPHRSLQRLTHQHVRITADKLDLSLYIPNSSASWVSVRSSRAHLILGSSITQASFLSGSSVIRILQSPLGLFVL